MPISWSFLTRLLPLQNRCADRLPSPHSVYSWDVSVQVLVAALHCANTVCVRIE